eukprot:m.273874 g.273874  ORF g.273874 m.273874 type:complete len:209 (+) comp16282_c7_seq36:2040-2666(+)
MSSTTNTSTTSSLTTDTDVTTTTASSATATKPQLTSITASESLQGKNEGQDSEKSSLDVATLAVIIVPICLCFVSIFALYVFMKRAEQPKPELIYVPQGLPFNPSQQRQIPNALYQQIDYQNPMYAMPTTATYAEPSTYERPSTAAKDNELEGFGDTYDVFPAADHKEHTYEYEGVVKKDTYITLEQGAEKAMETVKEKDKHDESVYC